MLAKLVNALKQSGVIGLALLIGLSVPLLVWAAAIFCLRQIYKEWWSIRGWLRAGKFTCGLDTDCPPGYVCIDGRCMPDTAR